MKHRKSLALVFSACVVSCGARDALDLAESTEPPEDVEVCNGRDDDGDGAVDEDLGELVCGFGACARRVTACDGGVPAVCQPGPPGSEICNGQDDDCDGAIDEDLGLARRGGPYLIDADLHYVARSQLVPTDAGLFAIYATSFDGSAPTPNARIAALDESGAPISAPSVLTERNMPNGPRMAPMNEDWLITYCGRFGTEDRAASGVVSSDGAFTEHGQREPIGNHCGAGEPDVLWTGERMLVGWVDNSTQAVHLDRAGADGVSVESTMVDSKGDYYSLPRFATNGDRTLMVYAIWRGTETRLRVRVLDREGHDAEEPLVLEPPNAGRTFYDTQVAVDSQGGFLLLGGDPWELGMYRARFDATGKLTSGPELVEDVELGSSPTFVLTEHPSGGFVLAGTGSNGDQYYGFVFTLDERGEVTSRWTTLEDPFVSAFGWPSIAIRDGRIFVAYATHEVPDPDFPELHVFELGCPL